MITRSRTRRRQLADLIGDEPLRLLEQQQSLLPAWDWMKQIQTRYGINNTDVLIGLDFDGTISCLDFSKQIGPDWEFIRGGKGSRLFLNLLDEQKYRWYIISARAYCVSEIDNIIQTMSEKMNLQFPSVWCQNDPVKFPRIERKQFNAPYTDLSYRVLQCSNIIGCIQEEGGEFAFDKEVAFEYAMTQCLPKPRLVVFVDDNAENVLQVQQHYCNHHPDILFLGVFYFPQRDIQEFDYELAEVLRSKNIQIIKSL
jgi:hypothetical protein